MDGDSLSRIDDVFTCASRISYWPSVGNTVNIRFIHSMITTCPTIELFTPFFNQLGLCSFTRFVKYRVVCPIYSAPPEQAHLSMHIGVCNQCEVEKMMPRYAVENVY